MKLFGENFTFGNEDPTKAMSKKYIGDYFTRFVNSFADGVSNWWKGFTGSGLTRRDVLLNDMNMQNVEDTANAQVKGYEKAGINPALMFGSGSQTSPQTTATPTNGSMSELMQAVMIPLQMKMMYAQIGNVKANTAKTLTDTEQVKQIMDWYPRLSQANLEKLISSKGLDIANTNKAEAERAIADIEKLIKQAEADNAPALYRARVALEEAKIESEKARAASDLANATWIEYETRYTKEHNGARPSSSSILALIDAISSWTGLEPGSESSKNVISQVIDDFKAPENFYKKGIEQGKNLYKKGKSYFGSKWSQFRGWVNKEKRLF